MLLAIRRWIGRLALFTFLWMTFSWRTAMNLLEEAKKLFDKGKPLVEGAVSDFVRRQVKDFFSNQEFEIRKQLGIDQSTSSKAFRRILMDLYDEYIDDQKDDANEEEEDGEEEE